MNVLLSHGSSSQHKWGKCRTANCSEHSCILYSNIRPMYGHTVYCVRILPDTCTPFLMQCEMLWLITDQLVFFYCTWSSTSSWSQLWWTWDRNLFTASFSADSTSIWIVSRGIFRYSCRHIDLGLGSILWVHVCEQQYILVWLYLYLDKDTEGWGVALSLDQIPQYRLFQEKHRGEKETSRQEYWWRETQREAETDSSGD